MGTGSGMHSGKNDTMLITPVPGPITSIH